MTPSHLIVEHDPAGFVRVLLDRPAKRNALDVGLGRALAEALAADPGLPVLLGSTSAAFFCAGADLTLPDSGRAEVSELVYDCCALLITRPAPVIAFVTGAAVGGGAQLAAAADLRIAGTGARFRWVGPPGRGLAVGAWILPALVGRSLAADLVLTGRWLDSAEALGSGLIHRVSDDPRAEAERLAADLAASDSSALARAKGLLAGDLLARLGAEREANRAAFGASP
jgi:enoyl-CoA hydratase/carnithine racemase